VNLSKELRDQAKARKQVITAAKFEFGYAEGGGGTIHLDGTYTQEEAQAILRAFMDREKNDGHDEGSA
jgi:hypothetical protein